MTKIAPWIQSEESTATSTGGWRFDLSSNTLTFTGTAPALRSEMMRRNNATWQSADVARHNVFHALHGIIAHLHHLPPSDPMAVDSDAAAGAAQVLNLLSHYDVSPPRVFSHGGDAVVFTWDFGDVSRYLTVAGDELTQLDIQKVSGTKSEEDIDLSDDEQRAEWVESLGVSPITSSKPFDAA